MKFELLTKKAEELSIKLGEYVCVQVEFNSGESIVGRYSDIRYTLYTPGEGHNHFKTSQELLEAIERRIDPPGDMGVTL